MTEAAGDGDRSDPSYGGILGAIGYAVRQSDSWLLRSYVVVGSLLVAFMTLLFAQSVVVLLGSTAGATGGTFTFSRAFVIVVALFVIGPLLAPIVSTARRHRHGTALRRTDALVAGLGYLIVAALYVALVISAPPELRDPAEGALAPIVETLYGLSPVAATVPLAAITLATYAIWRLHRRAR